MNWERAWMIAAALLVITAAVLLWRNNLSAAFVIAALGACAWFLSYRAQLRQSLPDDTDDEPSNEEYDEVSTDRVNEVSTADGSDRVNEVSTESGSDRVNEVSTESGSDRVERQDEN